MVQTTRDTVTSDDAELRRLIRGHEGERRFPYVDTVGKTSIGIGRNLTDVGLYPDEIAYLFTADLKRCLTDLATFPWFSQMNDVRQRAVCDLRFQLGPDKFRGFHDTLAALARGDYNAASDHLMHSKYAQQVPVRAQMIAGMIATGQDVKLV